MRRLVEERLTSRRSRHRVQYDSRACSESESIRISFVRSEPDREEPLGFLPVSGGLGGGFGAKGRGGCGREVAGEALAWAGATTEGSDAGIGIVEGVVAKRGSRKKQRDNKKVISRPVVRERRELAVSKVRGSAESGNCEMVAYLSCPQ